MELKYCSIDLEKSSREEILKEIARLEVIKNEKQNEEQGIKIFINSVYGASASAYFIGYNINVAEAITLQGQDIIFFAEKILNRYFNDHWHNDRELHALLGITGKVEKVTSNVVVYGDTDSVAGDSVIPTERGDISITNLYDLGYSSAGDTIFGHESVNIDFRVKNWSEERGVFYERPKRIIRHKVKKKKYRLKTKDGKEVVVTGDHSLIVWRNGERITTTAKDICKFDKVLVLK